MMVAGSQHCKNFSVRFCTYVLPVLWYDLTGPERVPRLSVVSRAAILLRPGRVSRSQEKMQERPPDAEDVPEWPHALYRYLCLMDPGFQSF